MKTRSILIAAILMMLFGCKSKHESMISEINKECGISLEGERRNDGVMFYQDYLKKDEFIMVRQKAKNIIDKRINQVGRETRTGYDDVVKMIFDVYEWETPKEKITMQTDYGEDRGKIRIWIEVK